MLHNSYVLPRTKLLPKSQNVNAYRGHSKNQDGQTVNSKHPTCQPQQNSRMMPPLMILPIILACSGSVIAENGYNYDHPYEWADPQANINNPSSVSPKNWTPAPERRSFQALVRDVLTERQAFFGLPLGVLAGVGGVSCLF